MNTKLEQFELFFPTALLVGGNGEAIGRIEAFKDLEKSTYFTWLGRAASLFQEIEGLKNATGLAPMVQVSDGKVIAYELFAKEFVDSRFKNLVSLIASGMILPKQEDAAEVLKPAAKIEGFGVFGDKERLKKKIFQDAPVHCWFSTHALVRHFWMLGINVAGLSTDVVESTLREMERDNKLKRKEPKRGWPCGHFMRVGDEDKRKRRKADVPEKSEEENQDRSYSELLDKVEAELLEHAGKPFSITDIVEKIPGATSFTVTNMLEHLEREGKIKRPKVNIKSLPAKRRKGRRSRKAQDQTLPLKLEGESRKPVRAAKRRKRPPMKLTHPSAVTAQRVRVYLQNLPGGSWVFHKDIADALGLKDHDIMVCSRDRWQEGFDPYVTKFSIDDPKVLKEVNPNKLKGRKVVFYRDFRQPWGGKKS